MLQANNLHSSMVRLEIVKNMAVIADAISFTFQYGQIRNNLKDKNLQG